MIMGILQIVGVWTYTHAIEYVVHRYLLHGFGRRKSSILAFHWRGHHKNARRNAMREQFCKREAVAVGLLVLLHLPLAAYSPLMFVTLAVSAAHYIYVHNKSHMDVEWGMKHLPWHYAHHMGKNQNANWGVRSNWIDRLTGTSVDMKDIPHDYR